MLKDAISERAVCATLLSVRVNCQVWKSCLPAAPRRLLGAQSTPCGNTSQVMELYINLLQWGEGRDLSLLSLLLGAGHLLLQVRIPHDGRPTAVGKRKMSFLRGSGCFLASQRLFWSSSLKAKPWSWRLCQGSHSWGLADPARTREKKSTDLVSKINFCLWFCGGQRTGFILTVVLNGLSPPKISLAFMGW